ncbi:DUF896 domain-containing protein [Lachnospira pectinoschiza]|uniref:UPF0291 protein SAMN05216544_0922 n=1 Tax=Lachnospira pectinoschiza TaxID=28052 RepID=A0A1G9VDY9_9FIRM|nr:DUF896 domain-containing protein [Lachnospira pectinoschiza]SDM70316.1 Uncharacterized protein YnzC, UPF0291/DUF896 family [Lachnospira pectinoschiza]
MNMQERLDRINELYRKSKAEGLTTAEKEEQDKLRKEYVKIFRENLRGSLETIKIQNPDGSIIDVKERHDEKMRLKAEKELEEAKKNGN